MDLLIDYIVIEFRYVRELKFTFTGTLPLAAKLRKIKAYSRAYHLLAVRIVECAIPAMTRDLGSHSLIRITAPFSDL